MSTRPAFKLAGQGWVSRAFYQVFRAFVVGFCYVWMRTTVEGRENIPTTGGCVLAPVHRSYVDTPIAATTTRRRLRYMGKHTLWLNPVSGWLLSALGGFPVVRGTADREALRSAIEVLRLGEVLVVFPEGERKSGPIVQPLFDGAVYLAAKGGVPIVPVGIGGSERVMSKGHNMVYPRKVHVIVGEPITVKPLESGRVPRAAIHEATEELHEELQRLFDTAQARAVH